MSKNKAPTQIPSTTNPLPGFVVRFSPVQRIEHIVLLISFSLLGITGLPQKFPESPVSSGVLSIFGGVETARQIHHVSAIVLLIISGVHFLDVLYRLYVLRVPWTMLPIIDDFTHLFQDIGYYLDIRDRKAFYARYNYAEKAEYLAVVWGTVIMAITGFMMWNPISTTQWLPGEAIPAAKAAHGWEAVLAVVAIIIWHFYHVHLRHFNKSIFTGKLTSEEMKEEHPAEWSLIEHGKHFTPPDRVTINGRQKIFFPVAALIMAAFSFGVFRFVSVEKTAITTVPLQETSVAYVPQTPTPRPTPTITPTPPPAGAVAENTWKGFYEGLFRNRCGNCHGFTAVSGLTLKTYQSAVKGGKSGPGIVPGKADSSEIVIIQSKGNHPGQLSKDELQQVIDWINSGAPEQ